MEFTIKLAGIPVRVEALFESTRDYCRDYLTDEEPAFTVTSTNELIAAECTVSAETDLQEGRAVRHFPDAYLETLAVYRQIAEKMTERDVFFFTDPLSPWTARVIFLPRRAGQASPRTRGSGGRSCRSTGTRSSW